MERLFRETVRLLEKGESVVWATIVEQSGSSPRKTTTRILINSKGHILGSIGGGKLEAQTIEVSETLHRNSGRKLIDVHMTGQEVAGTEMICGGYARIFAELLAPEALPFVRKHYETFLKKGEAVFVTWIDDKERSYENAHFVLKPDVNMSDFLGLPQDMKVEVEKVIESDNIPVLIAHPSGQGFIFVESLKRASNLYIFGGGHISLDLAWIADRVGFEVIIVDDRAEFANKIRFPMACEVKAMPYKDALQDVQFGYEDFVVIVTRGHLHDLNVLREVIMHSPQYIGMIGSRRKKTMIFNQLQKEGVSKTRLDEIHAPIGLDILAETPAEISISIMAELIQVRAESTKLRKKTWHV